jgi:ammonia channel protein AmtB
LKLLIPRPSNLLLLLKKLRVILREFVSMQAGDSLCQHLAVLAIVGTVVIAMIVKVVTGLRPSAEVETAGLDVSEHGEEGYIL